MTIHETNDLATNLLYFLVLFRSLLVMNPATFRKIVVFLRTYLIVRKPIEEIVCDTYRTLLY
jgi:hypothetical protein